MRQEQQAILEVVGELSEELSPHHPPAQASSELEVELGLGSLERLELLNRLEKTLGKRLDERSIFLARYVSDLWDRQLPEQKQSSQLRLGRELPPFCRDTKTLISALAYQQEHQGQKTALVLLENDQQAGQMSYNELASSARRISSGLKALGVGPGDSVAVMLPTSLDFFSVFYGIINLGATAVPLYPPLRLDQFEDFLQRQEAILENCQARVLVTLPQFAPLSELLRQKHQLEHITHAKALSLGSPAPLRTGTPEEIALLQYTSGSTGQPKGVPLSHRNLLVNMFAIGKGFGLGHGDVMVSWLPLYHDMGLIGMSLASFVHGNPLVLMAPDQFLSRPIRWLRAFSDYGGSMTAAPNFAYAICAKKISDEEAKGLDLSSWRVALNGAEPVVPSTVRAFHSRFKEYGLKESSAFPAYGLAEATLAVSFTPLGQGFKSLNLDLHHLHETGHVIPGEDEISSCGFPVDDMEVRIVDEQGAELPENTQGQLEIRGESVMAGYLGHPKAGSWLRVGDLGFIRDGEIYITGRSKDLIVVGGRNIHPNDIEAVVGQVKGVRPGCVAVIGVDSEGTQRLVVLAETRQKESELIGLIQGAVSKTVAVPAEVVLLEPRTLPKTPSGKIRRLESKSRYLSGTLQKPRLSVRALGSVVQASLARSWNQSHLFGRTAWSWFQLFLAWSRLSIGRRPVKPTLQKLFRSLGVTIEVEGQPSGAGPLVLVANHASLLDGLLLLATWEGEPLRFAISESNAKHPLLKPIAKSHLWVRRGLGQAGQALEKMMEALESGDCLAIFPEGGIEPSEGLRGFALGAFQACTQTQARLQPVAICGSRAILAQGESTIKRGRVKIKYLQPMDSRPGGFAEAVALSRNARARIAEDLPEPCRETRLSRQD